MKLRRMIEILVVNTFAAAHIACGSAGGGLEQVTLVEGRGADPNLIIGATTVTQARSSFASAASDPSTTAHETTIEAGPFRLVFVAPDAGGEAVLHAIRTARIPNPNYPRWEGKTSRGIVFLDSEEKVIAAYGPPAAEWRRSEGGRALYYTSGAVFVLEHPSKITGYEGPPPTPTSAHVTELWITAPFEILEAPRSVPGGQLNVETPPRTTLRISL